MYLIHMSEMECRRLKDMYSTGHLSDLRFGMLILVAQSERAIPNLSRAPLTPVVPFELFSLAETEKSDL